MLIPRTIAHNTWTIGLYRPGNPHTRSCRSARTHLASSVIPQELSCEIFSFQPPASSWPERHLPRPPWRLTCPRGQFATSCSSTALSSTRRVGSPLLAILTKRATPSRSSKRCSPCAGPLTRRGLPARRWRSRTAGPFSSAATGAAWSSRKPATIPTSRRSSTSPLSRRTWDNPWRPSPRAVRQPKAHGHQLPTRRQPLRRSWQGVSAPGEIRR